jgi:thioredoxin reductase (NADPH)
VNDKPEMRARHLVSKTTAERMFPVLPQALIERIERHGQRRPISPGELLAVPGQTCAAFNIVLSGAVEISQGQEAGGAVITEHSAGQFTGEVNLISGRPSLLQARVTEAGEVIQLDHDALLELVQTDSDVSEILMRAFILRRVELIAHGLGDTVVLGSNHCSGTLRVKEFLGRNVHPFSYIDLDHDADVQQLLDRFQVSYNDVPVLIIRGSIVLRNPDNREIAHHLGFNEVIDSAELRDLVIVGAGPAGLAAAVYAASEGLNVLVIENKAPGGQSGASSKIENYLGFPTGISGQALAGRAYAQAQKFGAQVVIAQSAQRLDCDQRPYAVLIDDDLRIPARTIMIATGAEYRKPGLGKLAEFEGTGVYYAATHMEAQLCPNEEVIVVGGGNSAGQAAVFLAESAKCVHVMVRSDGLADSMSRYLIHRIEEHPRIQLHVYTEITALEGAGHLEQVTWRSKLNGEVVRKPVRHLFLMMGADPSTRWLEGCLVLDEKGFIKTGNDIGEAQLKAAEWPLARAPYLLETSLPGVFAVGDVRSGNVKRVASAVGEGAIAVSMVHRVLSEG